MSWATIHIDKLRRGETVSFRPRGGSMQGKVESGQLVTVAPLGPDDLVNPGDVVLVTVHGNTYLHLVRAVRRDSYQIGNALGRINGWVSRGAIHGRLTKVEA